MGLRSNKKNKRNKKGFMFTMDALFASIILITGLILVSRFIIKEHPRESIEYTASDVLSVLSELKMSDIYASNSSFVTVYLSSNNTNVNLSVLEQLGTYWAANESSNATNLSYYLLNGLLPDNTGITLGIGDDDLFNNSPVSQTHVYASDRMITGVLQGAPISGSTSSAYLRKINDKRTKSFAYFGGFVGQGNISFFLEGIPSDISSSQIIDMVLELSAIGNFNLLINGDNCGYFMPSATNMSPDVFDITSCNSSIIPGRNNISFIFDSPLNTSYIAGGYLRVDYKTNEPQQDLSSGIKRYYFPGIGGLINLFDSIYAPGVINGWVINISFLNNYTTYLTIGNETIFSADGKNYTQNLTYAISGLSINPSTIPIRLGTMNFSNVTQVITGEAADTILVTDTSGSMADCGELTTQLMCGYDCCIYWLFGWWCPGSRECIHPGTCNNQECGACSSGYTARNYETWTGTSCLKTKMDIAKESDKLAVDIILNSSANKIGLVGYSTSVVNPVSALSQDSAGLKSSIDSYSANGGTCTCCGINKAKDLVLSSSQKKFIILLSDGDPTFYCKNFSDYSGSGVWAGDSTGASSSTTDRNWAIGAGETACNNSITVFAIGFGSSMSADGHDTMRRIACNDSLYFNASNVSILSQIYRNISDLIVSYANYTFQTITITGNMSYSQLMPGSYIEMNYTPIVKSPVPNEISLEIQTPQFNNCSANINIPSGIRIVDARVTSYSGEYWTKTLIVNSASVYNLSNYGENYNILGDPYIVQIPSVLLTNGSNNIFIETGDSPENSSGCSFNNSLIYTALVPSSTVRSSVVERTDGCLWTIQFEDDTNETKSIPQDYSGLKRCSYTATNHTLLDGSYDNEDAYDIAVFNLLRTLDFDNNGKVFVNLDSEDIEIVITTVSSVPYLWGPSLIKAKAWQ